MTCLKFLCISKSFATRLVQTSNNKLSFWRILKLLTWSFKFLLLSCMWPTYQVLFASSSKIILTRNKQPNMRIVYKIVINARQRDYDTKALSVSKLILGPQHNKNPPLLSNSFCTFDEEKAKHYVLRDETILYQKRLSNHLELIKNIKPNLKSTLTCLI